MFFVLKSSAIYQILSFAALLVCSSIIYAAPHSAQLDDFHPNCNFRQLNLSQEQHSALRRIRLDYKSAADKAYKKEQRTDRTRRRNIMSILNNPKFDQNNARDYVESRYLSRMDFAVDELAIQHRIYHLLTPSQRQIWLNTCLR
ncbi:Spy/CpxP family protein refolding chaperone [Neisseria sp. CCUG17229]|uniref:Spy/CpxP family protein refolding chaperone n=1 Tax=Neisseria sp. CCUG17229 TaxID=3392036 RepID=UPI003A0FD1C0